MAKKSLTKDKMGGNIFIHITDKGLTSIIHKEDSKLRK